MRVIALAMACLFSALLNTAVKAQNPAHGAIKGRVTVEDGTPVPGVGLRLKDSRKQTTSNESGTYTLRNITPGTYVVEAFITGRDVISRPVTVTAGQTAEVDFQLSTSRQNLQEVIVASGRNKFAKKETDYVARMPLKNLENPQVYSIIGSELMQEQVIVDYKDAIKNVAGVNSTETVGNGRTSTIIRGFRTQNFIRNGMTANQLVTVDVSNLERIEVIKGPSGTLFGTGAVSYGGLVNRVTKKPFDTFKTDVSLTAGSYNLNRITVDLNAPLNKEKTALLRVNFGRHAQESFQEAGFKRNYFLSAAFSYQANDRLSFLVDLETFRNRGTPSIAYLNPAAGVTDYKEAMGKYYKRTYYTNDLISTFPGYNVFAQMNYKINNNWNTTTVFSTGGVNAREQYQFTGNWRPGTDSITRQLQKYSHNYNTIQLQQNLNGTFHTGSIKHRVLVGLDYLADITQPTYTSRFILDTVSAAAPTSFLMMEKIYPLFPAPTAQANNFYKSHLDRYGVYASDVINFTDRLLLMLSLRWDKVDNQGTTNLLNGNVTGRYSKSSFSPKFGAVYQLIKDQLSVFANYQNGFTYSAQTDKQGNLFKPEQANQWEGGVKAELLQSKLNVTLSAYDISVTDKLRSNPEDPAFSIQDGTQKSKGFEAEVIANPFPGLNITAGYGFNESEITKASANVGKRPARSGGKHMANTWISYRLVKGKLQGLGIGGGVFYNSETPFDDANTLFFPAYALVNSTVFYDRPGYRIGIKLDNVSNTLYWGPWGEPQPPRNYAVNLVIKL
ncbi:TonB-dependent receptor [Chitinophaga sp. CC14]|uniref:TonB-dependent siderophore receptor n=1 Tax=Chitinophaga sp. CC14 TaxID=3029199 RepID=UPI003B769645